jgi:hypothetical protein
VQVFRVNVIYAYDPLKYLAGRAAYVLIHAPHRIPELHHPPAGRKIARRV